MTNIIRSIILLLLVLNTHRTISQVNLPFLNLNVPINSVAGTYTFHLINSCSSQDFHIIMTPTNAGLIPIADGVNFVLKITNVTLAFPSTTLTCTQTGTTPVVAGSTFTFTSSNPQFQFTSVVAATVNCQFLVVGTPTTPNQSYECGYNLSVTLSNCQNAAMLNGSSSSSVCSVGVSNQVNEVNDNTSSFSFPSLTNGEFTLQAKAITENTTVEILSLSGQLVFKKNITQTNTQIDLSAQPKGIYLLSIYKENTLIHSKKLLKE